MRSFYIVTKGELKEKLQIMFQIRCLKDTENMLKTEFLQILSEVISTFHPIVKKYDLYDE